MQTTIITTITTSLISILIAGIWVKYFENHNFVNIAVDNKTMTTHPLSYDDPCCAYPCQNQGVCMTTMRFNDNNNTTTLSFSCYCDEISDDDDDYYYYGTFCEKRKLTSLSSLLLLLLDVFKPSSETLHKIITSYDYLWKIVNNIPFLHSGLIRYIYLSRHDMVDSPAPYQSDHSYITLDSYFNQSYYVRALPPVPLHCPTPMGIWGPPKYPDIDVLIDSVFMRRHFIPDPHNTNVLFLHYAQHFTHQFFRTDFKKGPQFLVENSHGGGVDASNIYGLDESDRRALRLGRGGKLKTQIINGEEFPPRLCGKNTNDLNDLNLNDDACNDDAVTNNKNDYYPPHTPSSEKFALGHPFFALLPGLFAFSTIWIREHNRICNLLAHSHPHWDDERLFQTTRLIIVAQMIKITLEEYVQHLSQYNLKLKFDPKLIHGTKFQYHNRIHAEFNLLYHWHPLVPDDMYVNGTKYTITDTLYSTKPIFNHGFDQFIHAMVTTRAGALTTRNHARSLRSTLKNVLINSRKLRFQSINAYRRRFGMQPFQTFEEMTGGNDPELSDTLKSLYGGDIEAVEFYVGLLADKQSVKSVTSLSMVTMGGPWSIKGLLSNPICSPKFWKPSTFGGKIGMDIIENTTLETLFCQNMKSKCNNHNITISFRVVPTV